MVENSRWFDGVALAMLLLGAATTLIPLYLMVTTATLPAEASLGNTLSWLPGDQLLANLASVWTKIDLGRLLLNSLIISLVVVVGKLALSSITAFAIVFFDSPLSDLLFWIVLLTLMLPLEIRIVPTYAVAADVLLPFQTVLTATGLGGLLTALTGVHVRLGLNLLDTYAGLTLPLIGSAMGTFLFRQFYRTIPPDLIEAARMDGVGPLRFFFQFLLPLSKTNFAALACLMFVASWNQYLWPLMVTADANMRTAVVGVSDLKPSDPYGAPSWNLVMAAGLVTMAPPVAVVAFLQRWFVKGLMAGGGK